MIQAQSENDDWLGDILIVFGEERAPTASGRGGAELVKQRAVNGVTVYESRPCDTWKGSPRTALETDHHHATLIGSLYGGARLEDLDLDHLDAANLNGHFVLVIEDKRASTWRFVTSRFGSFHAYVSHRNGRAASFSTFFPACAASSGRTLDRDALLGFFSFGFFVGERTFFEEVSVLGPACDRVYDRTGRLLEDRRSWDWHHAPDTSRTEEETLFELDRRLREVMAEHVAGGRVALPISGGLDSRTTVAALPAEHAQLFPYSYDYSERGRELSIAAEVASARGLPLAKLVTSPYLFERAQTVIDATEGFQDLTQCRQASVIDELAPRADYVIAAHWGDVWFSDMGFMAVPSLETHELASAATKKLTRSGSEWLVKNVLGPKISESAGARLRAQVEPTAKRLDGIEDVDFRFKALKTDLWSARWTLTSLRMFQPAAFPRLVFYDTRLVDFLSTVPSSMIGRRSLQIEYLKRFSPDLAKIRWDAYDADLYRYRSSRWSGLPKRVVRKLGRKVTNRQPVLRNWELQFSGEDGREGLHGWLLRPGLRLHELVGPTAIASLLEDLLAKPDAALGYTVSMLLSFSLWLEHHG